MIIEDRDQATWSDSIRVGDIVAFRFPHETDGDELPKVRPTLVLEVDVICGKRHVTLAYGTTSPRRCRGEAYTIDVYGAEEIAEASLRRPTRFYGARRLRVSCDNSWFGLGRDRGTPKIGRLSGESLERLLAVRARIHAERDIRADRTRQRRTLRRGLRPVTVERRRAGKRPIRELRHV
ncbi:hypothetical protein [Mameliella sp.]|uniref:hypothetical protein n=1 Tax=Mameliella sp. TaxID=1924940 RepID=UPI003B513A86